MRQLTHIGMLLLASGCTFFKRQQSDQSEIQYVLTAHDDTRAFDLAALTMLIVPVGPLKDKTLLNTSPRLADSVCVYGGNVASPAALDLVTQLSQVPSQFKADPVYPLARSDVMNVVSQRSLTQKSGAPVSVGYAVAGTLGTVGTAASSIVDEPIVVLNAFDNGFRPSVLTNIIELIEFENAIAQRRYWDILNATSDVSPSCAKQRPVSQRV